jgi:hypothetical protein
LALEGSTEQAQFTDVIDPSVEPDHGHGITTPVAIDPSITDPSLMAACWETSDELMPSGD